MTENHFLSFFQTVALAFLGFLNVWAIFILTWIKEEIRDLRRLFTDHIQQKPRHEKKSVDKKANPV